MKLNDILLAVHGEKVGQVREFIESVQRRKTGEAITLKIKRGETELELKAILAKRPDWQIRSAELDLEQRARLARLDGEALRELREAEQWLAQAEAFHKRGDAQKAAELAERALASCCRVLGENNRQTAGILFRLGGYWDSAVQPHVAQRYVERYLAINQKILGSNHPDTAMSLHFLGYLLFWQGDHVGARPRFEQALAIRQKVLGANHPVTADSLHAMAVLLSQNDDFAGAQSYLEKALVIRRNVFGAEHPDIAKSLNSLGSLLERTGKYAAARPYYDQALAIRKKLLGDDHIDTAGSLNNLGSLLMSQGDYDGARPYFEQALASIRKARGDHHPLTALFLNNLAVLEFRRGDYPSAERHVTESLALFRRYIDLVAQDQAERQQLLLTRQVRARFDHYLSLASAAKLPATKVYPLMLSWKGAITARQRSLKQALVEPDLAPLAKELQKVTTQLSQLAFANPDPSKRDDWLRQIEKLTSDKERLERQLASQSKTLAKLLPEPRVEDLTETLPAESALIDFLQYDHFTPPKGKGPGDVESRLLAFIVRPKGTVTCVELGASKAVVTAVMEWRQEMKKRSPTAGARLRRLIWEPLEAHLASAKTLLVSPDGILNQLPFAALPGKEPGKFLIEDHAVMVAPLPRWLPQMLESPDKSKDGGEPSLLLLGDVDFAAAAGTADKDAKVSLPAPRAGLFKEWRPLPGTRGEIATIRDSFEQRFPDGKVKVLRGAGATEAALRQQAPKHRILHLATHGFFAPESLKSALAATRGSGDDAIGLFDRESISGFNPGLLSGLVLAGANRSSEPGQDDGILTALAVADLDLRKVELVVLSACETGLGQEAGGEGILGLQRAFQVAGAKSVVASLWSVDDEATRKLMERFYENHWQKKMSKADALRQAQLSMLRGELVRGAEVEREKDNRLPPFYWAAFVLSGDWR